MERVLQFAGVRGAFVADLVIGSGPAGVSAAKARLALGRRVAMIDVGEQLEPQLEARRAALAASNPDTWNAQALAAYKAPQLRQGQEEIRRYGSDFLVREGAHLFEERPGWLALRASFARGGLSNAWGAAVLPYRQEDLSGWPIGIHDLAPHYRAVAEFMPIAGERDELEALFPTQDMSAMRPLAKSAQANALLARAARARGALSKLGVTAGAARQAVAADCRRCGLCLHGCPYEYIFKASQVVDAMQGHPGFEYRPGLRAVSFEESQTSVRVRCVRADGSTEVVEGERLFLAGGVLTSAQVVLRSVGHGRELELRDSQHMFLPMLHSWRTPGDPVRESRHALAQVFLELADPKVSPFTVHAQVYTYSEFYAQDMRRRYGRRFPVAGPLFEAVAQRLIVSQLFLHSEHSHRIAVRLASGGRVLDARLIENPDLLKTARKAKSVFAKSAARMGLFAVTSASRLGAPGSSFHVGSSMPMQRTPVGLNSDILGRPGGLQRVHVVDASVFPSVPATTITYSVMANAHRIAVEAP